MNQSVKRLLLALGFVLAFVSEVQAKTIRFCGYDWNVRSAKGGPGPNLWDENNVWLDAARNLHLKISQREGKWWCAELTMQKRLGFGCYQFQTTGRIDRLDDNVVLGLFNYPAAEVGPDGTHEVDIEFARWGDSKNPPGNYTVWPVEKGLSRESKSFAFALEHDQTTHRFTWNETRVLFQSLRGLRNDDREEFSRWLYSPKESSRLISRQAMPVHMNLWLFQGRPPKNGAAVEVVVNHFKFTPE